MTSSKSSFCQLCGKPITDTALLYYHPDWPAGRSLHICAQCDAHRPRCQVCGLPMVSASPEMLCQTCERSAKRCLTCGKLIRGRFIEVDGVSPFCETCCRERPPCDVCAAPLTDEHWQLSDGRLTCARCHLTAIYHPSDVNALYEELQDTAASLLGLALNIPTGVALVDRKQLDEIIRKHCNGASVHDPRATLGLYTRHGTRRGIYVQSGLPRLLMMQVIAHEFAHAWQGENCPLLRQPLVHEGFAEWVAYKILGGYGLTQRQERMLLREDVYGMGLKWALEVEASQGEAGVVSACRLTR